MTLVLRGRFFYNLQMKLLLVSYLIGFPLFAATGSLDEAQRVRGLIEQRLVWRPQPALKLELPVSRGFHQKGSQLCWAYATLNVLESNYMAIHPQSKPEFSRRSMQFSTMKDRYSRYIHGTENFISERGVAIDALQLIRSEGLVAFEDFVDSADPYGSYDFKGEINKAATLAEKLTTLFSGLDIFYSTPPLETHFEGVALSRGELVRTIVGNQI